MVSIKSDFIQSKGFKVSDCEGWIGFLKLSTSHGCGSMTYLASAPVNKRLKQEENSVTLKYMNSAWFCELLLVCGSILYLSLSLISSTTLFCPLGTFVCRFPDICVSKFPLLLACLNASSVFALAGYCGGFSPWSRHLPPLACLTLAAPLAPPVMVVLLRRVAGPLISALSLISAAPITQVYLTSWALLLKTLRRFFCSSIRHTRRGAACTSQDVPA